MSTTDKVCYLTVDTEQFYNDFKKYGFSFSYIRKLLYSAKPNTVGIIGSYVFKYVSESLNIPTHNWKSQPSDIDICITDPEIFKDFCLFFKRRNFHIEYEFANYGYCKTMVDVSKVVNIKPYGSATKYIQLILLKCKTVEEHLRNVDFDFTRVVFTNQRFMCIGNAIESITSRKCKFPSYFRSVKQFHKTWKRSIKYIGRGIKFDYPDVINIERYDCGYIVPEASHMYNLTYCTLLHKIVIIKNVTVTKIDSPEEKLKQISEIVSSTEIKKLKEDFEKKITERNFKISVLEKELFNGGVKLSDAKKQLDEMKSKLINLKTSILKQFNQVQEQQKFNGWDENGWDDNGWDDNDIDHRAFVLKNSIPFLSPTCEND